MNKPILPFLETMITQACNLSCLGCTNYSDLKHSGYVSWAQGREQLLPWLDKIEIPDFGIIGGEPLINPEVREWLLGIRQLLPLAQIRFTTNGLLLQKNLDLIELASQLGNVVFKITVHTHSESLEEIIKNIQGMYKWQSVFEFGIHRYITENNFRLQISRPRTFLKTYRNDYKNMMPHESDPARAFEICCQQKCPLLHQGRIYKCSTSALLADTLEKFDNPNFERWLPFLADGIGASCSNDELQKFIDNFGKPHKICSQCPEGKDLHSKIDHLSNVEFKSLSYKGSLL